jgi:hypothetical protein
MCARVHHDWREELPSYPFKNSLLETKIKPDREIDKVNMDGMTQEIPYQNRVFGSVVMRDSWFLVEADDSKEA